MQALEVLGFLPSTSTKIPLFTMSVIAGIPVPVEEDIDQKLDLNEFLIDHPATTFFVRVFGDLFEKAGIDNGDILIADSSITPENGKFVIIKLNGELTVKIYKKINGADYLISHDDKFMPTEIYPYLKYELVGVVTRIIHSFN